MVKGGVTYYLHQNHLGSVAAVTDEEGNIVSALTEYQPFGLTRSGNTNTYLNYGFTDQELDSSTGLYNYDARLYDPGVGMFLTADTIVPDWTDPQSLNRYAYCRNNPVMYVDPDGHVFGIENVVGAVIGAISAGIQSGWDFDSIMVGASVGFVSSGVASWAGGVTSASVASATGEAAIGEFAGAVVGGAAGGANSGGMYAAYYGGDIGEGILNGAVNGYGAGFITGGLDILPYSYHPFSAAIGGYAMGGKDGAFAALGSAYAGPLLRLANIPKLSKIGSEAFGNESQGHELSDKTHNKAHTLTGKYIGDKLIAGIFRTAAEIVQSVYYSFKPQSPYYSFSKHL